MSTFYTSLNADADDTSGQVETWIDVMEFPEAGVPTMPIAYTKITNDEAQGFDGETIHYQMNMRNGMYMDNNPPHKYRLIVSPVYQLQEFPNACTPGLLFSC